MGRPKKNQNAVSGKKISVSIPNNMMVALLLLKGNREISYGELIYEFVEEGVKRRRKEIQKALDSLYESEPSEAEKAE